ncbi:TPA: ATP-binding protein [Vibrio diabolicus]
MLGTFFYFEKGKNLNSKSTAFKARARTIDHLGKGQIADAPTAVSELWKNSYDAYARDVALHLFDGGIKSGALIDNGCGMTYEQLIDSWLVIGTESKSTKKLLPAKDRFGLPLRFTQGEKGIGRLSTAFLAPVTLLVTKKIDSNYSIALIDWRMFENTYLSLSDIKVATSQIEKLEELFDELPKLLQVIEQNLAMEYEELGSNPSSQDIEMHLIRQAWKKFSLDEKQEFDAKPNRVGGEQFVSTEERIKTFCSDYTLNPQLIESWDCLLKKTVEEYNDLEEHGTALFLLDLERDLSLLTNRGELSGDDPELQAIESDLVDTLRSFVDPFEREGIHFNYEIRSVDSSGAEREILNHHDVFNYSDFSSLEHKVEGTVDEKGWFRGCVTAFGKEKKGVIIRSNVRFSNGISKVGAFKLAIGSFESDKDKSTFNEKEHAIIESQAKKYGGLLILRDSLRVLPYGRIDNDFFEMEERRGKSAGRYFWASRKTFGQISLNQIDNKNLKDKAGREGFIKNQAARELKLIVIDLLVNLADEFFGSKSDERKNLLNILNQEKEARKNSQKKATRLNEKDFRNSLKELAPLLDKELHKAREVYSLLQGHSNLSVNLLDDIIESLGALSSVKSSLKVPTRPAKMNPQLEDSYRLYRDSFNEMSEIIRTSLEKINQIEAKISTSDPISIASKKFNSNQALLNSQVKKYEQIISQKLIKLNESWQEDASIDRKKYHEEAISVLDSLKDQNDLETTLNILDSIYVNLADTYTIKYESVIRAVDRLTQGVNLESAFSMAEEERVYFEEKASKIQALAQLGISVEIMAHELEQKDMLVTRGLNSLPKEVKSHPGYVTAYEAHKSLTNQIRFLSPLKLSGYQARQDITGDMIEKHIKLFFRDRFERQRVRLDISDKFRGISIVDLPSRIYPVFVNILNNALYWVSLSESRLIKIDLIDSLVVIANSGPAVDVDDAEKLFDLFYSKRTNGHGVGLYLCRENLAVAHHKIWYSSKKEEMIINDGANFVIDFNGLELTK